MVPELFGEDRNVMAGFVELGRHPFGLCFHAADDIRGEGFQNDGNIHDQILKPSLSNSQYPGKVSNARRLLTVTPILIERAWHSTDFRKAPIFL